MLHRVNKHVKGKEMQVNNKIINYIGITVMVLAITACSGGGGDSKSGIYIPQDSDGDGFYDTIDPAPHDASNPGDFSSPEAIINNPKVKAALQIAKEHGVDINPNLGNKPPNLTGYYIRESRGGTTVATETGVDIGSSWVGKELRIETKGKHYLHYNTSFTDGGYLGVGYEVGSTLGGDGNSFTIYSPTRFGCFEKDGGNYSTPVIKIISGTRDSDGDLVNRRYLFVKVGTSTGTYTAACDARKPGGAVNKWTIARYAPLKNVDVDELRYMCIEDNKAYVPKEIWTNSEKQSCTCTKDIEIECN